MKSTAARAFWMHGSICASHPSEVLFIFITLTLTMISFVDWHKDPSTKYVNPDYHGVEVLLMTIVRCGAILFTYHQFQKLSFIGFKYFYGIAALVVVFSSIVFSCMVLKLLDCDISDLKDAIFIFLLVIDLEKAQFLVQFALESSSYKEVQDNIAEGLSYLGPTLMLDTIAVALLLGTGSLSGINRVEQVCGYGVLSCIVNYVFLVSFYPSFLSLVLQLSLRCSSSQPPWPVMKKKSKIDTIKSNPILHGVKIIMSAGLFLVHGITRWSFDPERHRISVVEFDSSENRNATMEPPFIVQWLNAGLEYAVLMVILAVVLIKYTFFETLLPLQQKTRDKHGDRRSSKGEYKKDVAMSDSTTQTEKVRDNALQTKQEGIPTRSLEECLKILKMKDGPSQLTVEEIQQLVEHGHINQRTLEQVLKNAFSAVPIRRSYFSNMICNKEALDNSEEAADTLPFRDYKYYDKVLGACCENVIGYVPVPVGAAGPLSVNGVEYMIPLATTEGALVASTSRGCKAITSSGGAKSIVFKDSMSRGPVVELPSAEKAIEVYKWIMDKNNYVILEEVFNSTSNFARLNNIHVFPAARLLFIRFEATTGDAMGMNMVAKGTEAALVRLKEQFSELIVDSISGNVCTDKKPSAINWILGRGKSVVCEVTIPSSIISSVLKTTAKKLVKLNIKKNFIGSSIAGSIGGNNAHAANIIAALFIACGQDPAQVVESSSCITTMERKGELGEDLYAAVTMPCLEVGTVGGGTILPPQAACLNMIGVKGPCKESSGENANRLATIAAASVLAGEISLMASLAEHTLVKSHLALNRRPPTSSAAPETFSKGS